MPRVSGQPRELPMRISINRTTSNRGSDYVRVELIDEASRCILARAYLGLEAFGLAVTGASEQPCTVTLFEGAPIGKHHEVKQELVPWPYPVVFNEHSVLELAQAAVAPYEVDGWRCMRLADAQNGHKVVWQNDQRFVTFSFERYVDPEDADAV